MKKLLNQNGDLLLSYPLLEEHGINKKTIEKAVTRKSVIPVRVEGKSYLSHRSLLPSWKDQLPCESLLRVNYKEQKHESLTEHVEKILQEAVNENYSKWFNEFNKKYSQLPKEKIKVASIKAALFERILTLTGHGEKKAAYIAFNKIAPKKQNGKDSFSSEAAFNVALSDARIKGIESQSIDKRALKEKPQSRYDKRVEDQLYALAISPVNFKSTEIHAALVEFCQKENIDSFPKPDCIKKRVNKILKNPVAYKVRYGAKAAFDNLEPYATINKAQHANTKWEIDGFFPPFYFGKAGEYRRLVLVCVIDNHSGKVIGKSFGYSENTLVIIEAINDAVRNTGYLPAEIVCDNHSFQKTKEAQDLKAKFDSYGIHWTVTYNPRHKAKIERFFRHFNEKYLKFYPGWTGAGILSKDINSRPSQEHIDKYQKPHHRPTEDQIKMNIIEALGKCNATKLKKYGKSPDEMYNESEKLKAIKLESYEHLMIFQSCTERKVIRGQITIVLAGNKFEFQLNAEMMAKYNNQTVLVRYEDLRQEIFISDIKNDAPIGFVKRKIAINGAIADQTQDDFDKLNQYAGRKKGFYTKAADASPKVHPDAFAIVNKITTQKDVQQQMQDAYVRSNVENLGIKTEHIYQPVPVNQYEDVEEFFIDRKPKKSTPFKPSEKHTISKLDLNDIEQ